MRTRYLLTILAAVLFAACGVHNDADHHHEEEARGHGAAEAEP